tara:strand:+ start:390 stop:1325 length:936 start_codon:yes stop_codon:yes gene_type:complete
MNTNDSIISDYSSTDDAAVVRLNDDRILLQTVDFFTPIVDDPYTFGQISAANSLSDIYAMGGKPLFALNIVAFPIQKLSNTILTEIMQGGADKADEAGIPIVGGHSIDDNEPKYGLVVTGEVSEKNIWVNTGAKPGDSLIITKPIGTGVISTAIKKEMASSSTIQSAVKSMAMLNKKASETLQKFNPNAVTDVTGFGLIGHLIEICKGSKVSAKINFSDINFLPGTIDLANKGIIPGGSKRNLEYAQNYVKFSNTLSPTEKLLACDAQTSGGLLISIPNNEADQFISTFGDQAIKIGFITEKDTFNVSIGA